MHVCFISRSNLDIFFLNSKTLMFFSLLAYSPSVCQKFFGPISRLLKGGFFTSHWKAGKIHELLSFTLESCVFLTLHRQKKHKPSAPHRTSRFHRSLDRSEDLVDTVVFYLPKACSGASKSKCLHDNQLSSIV